MKTLYIRKRCTRKWSRATLQQSLDCPVFEADQYFIDSETGEYKFDGSKIKLIGNWCKLRVDHSMEDDSRKIPVSNTFTQEWEMDGLCTS